MSRTSRKTQNAMVTAFIIVALANAGFSWLQDVTEAAAWISAALWALWSRQPLAEQPETLSNP